MFGNIEQKLKKTNSNCRIIKLDLTNVTWQYHTAGVSGPVGGLCILTYYDVSVCVFQVQKRTGHCFVVERTSILTSAAVRVQ
jgi:hypothetical protein